MPSNRVRDILVARIKQLMSQYEESKAISHPLTVGAMREQFLKSFLREMLPPKFSPVSGFIADMYGNITPQLDMIFIDRSELPTVSLVHDTFIVPAEIALLTAEVKSTLKIGHLTQIKKQRKAMGQLKPAHLRTAPPQHQQLVPTIILAFKSSVKEEKLQKWVKEEENLAGVCVVDKLSIFPMLPPRELRDDGTAVVETGVLQVSSETDYEPLLTFIGTIYRLLYILELRATMDWKDVNEHISRFPMLFWEGYLSEYLIQQVQPPS